MFIRATCDASERQASLSHRAARSSSSWTLPRKVSRRGHRDATMILVAYRHGLRASEVCGLEWHQIELDRGRLHVRRAKRGTPSVHPVRGDEIRALRRLRRENTSGSYGFGSDSGGAISHMGDHTI